MDNQVNSKNIILNYGIILGISTILIALVKYATGMQYDEEWYSGAIGFAATTTLIVYSIKKFKEINEGFLSFGQALKVGVGVAVISVLIYFVYLFAFTSFIEPEFEKITIEAIKKSWTDSGMTEEQVETMTGYTNDYFMTSLFGGLFVWSLFIGFVISAISGAIMKKSAEEQY